MDTDRACSVKQVSIIGTGDFGRALAIRLVNFGFTVTLGCRDPQKRGNMASVHHNLSQCKLTTIEEALMASDVIFLCIHSKHHGTIVQYHTLLRGKTLVDVSNPKRVTSDDAIAVQLANNLAGCKVVKAFNTLSAYKIESETSAEANVVPVAGDCSFSRQRILNLARDIGFHATDFGGLKSAKELERRTVLLLEGWAYPTTVAIIVWILWCIYAICRYYVIRKDNPYTWERLASNVLNKVFSVTALTLLATCYMPGSFAAFFQLYNGTKHKRFPRWLDRWLKMRKQFGLWAFFNTMIHLVLSVTLLNNAYYSSWYIGNKVDLDVGNKSVTITGVSRMNAMGEVVLLLGVLSTATMALLAISSLPSVSMRLNWKEWTFIQSWIGYLSLILGMLHVTVKGGTGWVGSSPASIVQGLTFLSSLPAWFAIAMKIILLLPCFSIKLNKIRHGYVRGSDNEVELGSNSTSIMSDPPSYHISQVNLNGVAPNGHVQSYDNKAFSETKPVSNSTVGCSPSDCGKCTPKDVSTLF